MKTRRLGRSGLDVSVIALGTNNFGRRLPDKAIADRIVNTALDAGINLIDTSNDYGGHHVGEGFIGEALKGRRDEAVLMTKVGSGVGDGPNQAGGGRAHIFAEVEGSLQALRTDHLDVLLVHRPDPRTPIEETLRVLDDLVRQGKVRYIGSSNFAAWEMCEAEWVSRTQHLERFVSIEPEYSMLRRDVEAELVSFCEAYGVGMTPFYPLAGGFLTGKYLRGQTAPAGSRFAVAANQGKRWLTDDNFELLDAIRGWCDDKGYAMTDVAFGWLLANPVVSSVIVGASNPEQVRTNVRAVELTLSDDEKAELDAMLPPPPVVAGALAQARESLTSHRRPGA